MADSVLPHRSTTEKLNTVVPTVNVVTVVRFPEKEIHDNNISFSYFELFVKLSVIVCEKQGPRSHNSQLSNNSQETNKYFLIQLFHKTNTNSITAQSFF